MASRASNPIFQERRSWRQEVRWWKLIGGVVVAFAACGGTTASSPDATSVVATDAGTDRPPEADASDAAATTPTWSAIYGQLLVNPSYPSNCAGSDCHDPGTRKGIDLSTAEKGWTTIQHRLSPGQPDASDLIKVLRSGEMPDGRPKMPAADIDRISAWIAAGAQDN
jgi:hypothetical protein